MPKISKAKGSIVVSSDSPEIPLAESEEGVGVVKLGEVSSMATWKSMDDRIEIIFTAEKLSSDRLRDLEHYRLSSCPIDVRLPGERQSVSCRMIGFDRRAAGATFYLTKAGKR